MNMIMRATLHQRASNTYYGQWPRSKGAVCCIESPAIAHNELVARAESAPCGVAREIPWEIAARRAANLCFDRRKDV